MKLSEKTKDILEWVYCIIIAIVLALLIKFFVGTPTIVKQPSMFPTLKQDQRLILNRWVRTIKQIPERGDIITFEAPSIGSYVTEDKVDLKNPTAKYENEPTNLWGKFVHYILEFGKDSYIKRVIGLPGDHIEIKEGKVYRNAEELNETYLQPEVDTYTDIYDDIIVPENYVFVMGDNRSQSTDSRRFGCIPFEKIESKVWIRFWPLNLFGAVE